jgi:CheY-like chemotaxis protein
VIFVGEIRDRETAEMAVQASLTGHLVLTTLHANDAVGAVARLRDLGVERSKIAATLRGSVAQRLARRACPDCSRMISGELTAEEARLANRYGVQPRVRVSGCPACSMSGYRGRLPLLEVLMSNPEFEALVASGGTPAELQRAAMGAGFRSLRENAIERVRLGQTTLQEISRVLGDAKDDAEEPVKEVSRILLVDDDVVTRTMARVVLQNNGFEVDEAADGAAALKLLNGGKEHSLMVLDLEMPVMGGREVLQAVRKSIATAGLPVLVLTGAVSDNVEVELMDEGADDYIRKPLEPGRFVARVRAALRRAAG